MSKAKKKAVKKVARRAKNKGAGRKYSVLSIRCPEALALRLDAYVSRLQAESPGVRWTRSSGALNLLELALKGEAL